ncbi:MAG: HTTM domain-containing protein [Nevskia sp.]|nr:HTTM domain-containing protein [Nevskia sp.]
MNWLRPRLAPLFGIDLRTLALFRILLGWLLLLDLCSRMADAGAFYSDAGVLPRSWLAQSGERWRISLHLANGQHWFALALLLLEALAALALAFGWRARAAAAACFVLHASLLNRNALVLDNSDVLLTCLLFWSMFLPLGARCGVDAALGRPPPDNRHLSWASAGLLLQVMSPYFFGALLKSGSEWWPDGTAVYWILQLDRYLAPAGTWLRQQQDLLPALTRSIYLLQLLGPPLAFFPLFNRPLRLLAMLLFIALQLGLALSLRLGLAPWVGIVASLSLTGGWVWDALDRRAQRREQRRGSLPLRIYYDRDCAFCLRSCLLLRSFLLLPRAEVVPAQDAARARTLLEANHSWVVIDHDDHAYLKWPALILLLRRSPLLGWLGWLLSGAWAAVPGNAAYDFIGRQRARFGALPARRERAFESGPCAQRVAALCALLLLAWNLSTVGWLPSALRTVLGPPLRLLRLDQTWNDFAPAPGRDDGWFVFPGELADGRQVDVLHPERDAVSYDKPASVSLEYRNRRWLDYGDKLWSPQFAEQRPYYGRYLCRRWNRSHPPQQALKSFKMIFMLEPSPPPGQTSTVEQRILWRQDCSEPARIEAAVPVGSP